MIFPVPAIRWTDLYNTVEKVCSVYGLNKSHLTIAPDTVINESRGGLETEGYILMDNIKVVFLYCDPQDRYKIRYVLLSRKKDGLGANILMSEGSQEN